MDTGDEARAAGAEMAAVIFDAPSLLDRVARLAAAGTREATLAEELGRLEGALRRLVDLRARGLAEGGPPEVTSEAAEKAGRLAALVSAWLAGGAISAEIEPLARDLFSVLGGDTWALPPAG